MNRVAIGYCMLEGLEQHHARTVASTCSSRIDVKWPAPSIGREKVTFLVEVSSRAEFRDPRGAGQSHSALSRRQAAAGLVHRHQRGRARRVNADTRARQV